MTNRWSVLKPGLKVLIAFLVVLILVAPNIANASDGSEVSTVKISICLGILVFAAVLLLTEAIPLAMTSLMVPVLLIFFRVIDFRSALSGFSNRFVLLFLMMFIIGDAMFRVGIADKIGKSILRLAKGSENLLVFYIMLTGGVMSAFLSNTGTAACLLPIIQAISKSKKISTRKLLIPMAFGVALGGMNTLIGTPPNGLVQAEYLKEAGKQFGFFEYAYVGIPVFIIGIIYMLTIGKKILLKIAERPDSGEYVRQEKKADIEYRRDKAWIVLAVFVTIIFFMVMNPLWGRFFPLVRDYFKAIPLVAYAIVGVIVIVSTKTLRPKEAYEAVDWTTIFLFAGMLGMSEALKQSGAAKFIGDHLINITGGSPYGALIGIITITIIATNAMSNTATTALFAPIALSIAHRLGVNPATLLMGVCLSASACFLTPVATPPNTLVVGPGDYRFVDFLKVGIALQVIVAIILVVAIPYFFPF